MSKTTRFLRMPAREKALFAEALLFLWSAKAMTLVLPFRTCLKTIKTAQVPREPEPSELMQVKQAIDRASHLTMWKNVCLIRSFAACWMLNRRGITSRLHIGFTREPGQKFSAHAWLTSGDFEITGSHGTTGNVTWP